MKDEEKATKSKGCSPAVDQSRGAVTACRTGAAALALLAALFTGPGAKAQTPMPICDRTPVVEQAILALIDRTNDCNTVTAADLAAITGTLDLSDIDLSALRAGDFDGLTSLISLYLANNELTSLPPGIFDDLTSLSNLSLHINSLTSLPAGIFDNLTNLTWLNLSHNSLTSLPPGIFDNLRQLQTLNLHGNNLADTDGDGVVDAVDPFPNDPGEQADTDRDGIGNNADTDDDNDGAPDTEDAFPLDPDRRVAGDRVPLASLVCPCTVESAGSGVTITAGIRNDHHRESPPLRFAVMANWENNRFAKAVAGYEGRLQPGQQIESMRLTTGLLPSQPNERDAVYTLVLEAQVDGNWGALDRVGLDPPLSAPTPNFVLQARSMDILRDSDADGVPDYSEGLTGTDPEDPQSRPGPAILDVMALYTPAAAALYDDEPLPRIIQHLEYGNQAFRNSNVNARLRLAHVRQVVDTAGDRALGLVTNTFYGPFEGIDAERERVGADLLVIYVDTADFCGIAGFGGYRSEGDLWLESLQRERVIAVVVINCRARTTVHEFGHNLGLAHAVRQDGVGTFPWSRAHEVNGLFNTIMVSGGSSATAVQLFSNPNEDCEGQPCGVDRSNPGLGADAALSLRATVYQAANWAPPPPDNDDDGLIDFEDTDDDNDGVSDVTEINRGTDPLDPTDATGEVAITLAADIAGDDVINIAEKAAGFAVSGTTGSGAAVRVTLGSGSARSATVNGATWTLTIPPDAAGVTGASVTITATATLSGRPDGTASRLLTVDLIPPTVTYTAPTSLTVGEAITAIMPGSPSADVAGYAVQSGALPAGLTLNASTGVISGTPTTAAAAAAQVTIRLTDSAGNIGDVLVTFPAVSPGTQTPMPICDRTPVVEQAILARIDGTNDCNTVTAADLAAITGTLDLSDIDLSALRAGDFDGLTSLITLYLANNELTSLPPGIFDDLTSLSNLSLDFNNLTSLPPGIFDNLTNLTWLNLSHNSLTSLPLGIFNNLRKIQTLNLDGNNLDLDDTDGDGALDVFDVFPNDPNEQIDTDGDGTGDNADTDDDNDGTPDVADLFPTDPDRITLDNQRSSISLVCPCTFVITGPEGGTVTAGLRNDGGVASGAMAFRVESLRPNRSWYRRSWSVYEEGLQPGQQVGDIRLAAHFRGSDPGPEDVFRLAIVVQSDDRWFQHDSVPLDLTRISPAGSFVLQSRDMDFLQDSDADGVPDYSEGLTGTDPGDAQSRPGPAVLDVMALYTPAAAALYGGEPMARIIQHLEYGNQALRNSDVNARLRLVDARRVNHTGNMVGGLNGIAAQAGAFEGIEAERVRVGADLLVLFVESTSLCGLADLGAHGQEGDFWYESRVRPSAAVAIRCHARTTMHELGHNLGLGHPAIQRGTGTFPWSRGHAVNRLFHTVMLSGGVDSLSVPFFSSPDTNCQGLPCGVDRRHSATGANAALSLRATVYQAANWAPPPPDNDADGIIDFEDTDDDNDGVSDITEINRGTDPLDPTDATGEVAVTLAADIAGDDIINIAEKATGFAVSGTTGSGAAVSVTLGSGSARSATVNGATWTLTIPPDAAGITGASVTITATATLSGRPDGTASRLLTVDLIAPTATYTAPTSLTVGEAITAIMPGSPSADVAGYAVQSGALPAGLTLNASTGAISGAPTTAGAAAAQVTIRLTDAAGNTGDVPVTFPAAGRGKQTLTGFAYSANRVRLDQAPPVLIVPTIAPTPGGALTYSTAPGAVCMVNPNTGVLTLVGEGSCTITATAAQTANYNAATAMFTITVTAPATITAGDDHEVAEDAPIDTNVGTALAPMNFLPGNAAWSIIAGNTGNVFKIDNSGQIQVAAALDFEMTQSYTLTVRLAQGGATATVQVTVTVTDVDEAAVAITIAEDIAGDDGINIAEKAAGFAVSGTTGSGAAVDVTLGSGSARSATVTGTAWTVAIPPDAAGITGASVTITATATLSGRPDGTASRLLTVDLIAPTATYTAPTSLTVGEAITAIMPGSPSTDVAGYAVQSGALPAGLTLNASTGAISGAPTTAAAAAQVTIRLTDAAGNTGDVPVTFPAVGRGTQTTMPICDRTPVVEQAILDLIDRTNDCNAVTATDLAAITGRLDLNDMGLSALRAGDFDGLTGLITLHLHNNSLTSLPPGIFDGLTSLESLLLSNNGLTSLPPGIFDALINLRNLFLVNNSLASLPPDIFDALTKLNSLHLLDAMLTSLPAGVFDALGNLTYLDLSYNNLTTLRPGVFDALINLRSLFLDNSRLTSLPAGIFDALRNLEDLYLSDNSLTTLPTGIFDALTNLRILDLQGNNLDDADEDGAPDVLDAFPNDPNEQVDTDGDGTGDNADTDDDDDGVPDVDDAFPTDPNRWVVRNSHALVSLVCPCTVASAGPDTVTITAGLHNESDGSSSNALRFTVVSAGPDNRYFTRAQAMYAGRLQSEQQVEGIRITTSFSPSGAQEEEYMLVIEESFNNLWFRQDSVVLDPPLAFPAGDFVLRSRDVLQDSDADGVPDYSEGLAGTDPEDAQSRPGPAILDVMVLYTPGAAALYGGEPMARIIQHLEYGNQVFRNSNVNARLRLVDARRVNHTGSLVGGLDGIKAQFGVFEGIEAERDRVGADLLMLFVEPDSLCGLADLGAYRRDGDFWYESRVRPASAVAIQCHVRATIHEFGHNLGLGHPASQRGTGTFPWARGHVVDRLFYTVMLSGGLDSLSVPFFSSPDLNCRGQPCGVDRTDKTSGADAALSLRATVYQAANWAPPPPDNDGDGVIDFEDADDDNDGVSDVTEIDQGTDPLDPTDATGEVAIILAADIAGDDIINIAEKAAGFAVSGTTASGAAVSVTLGSGRARSATVNGANWALTIPPDAAGITGASLTITATAALSGRPDGTASRLLTVDLIAPTATYTAPPSLAVGEAITAIMPGSPSADVAGYAVQSGALPPGLTLNASTGAISGAPTAANTNPEPVAIRLTDVGGNTDDVSVTFPAVGRGEQTLTGFAYTPARVRRGQAPPVLTPPTGVQTGSSLSYSAAPSSVCTANADTGALTLVGRGACTVTVTASQTGNHNAATATFIVTVTVPAGPGPGGPSGPGPGGPGGPGVITGNAGTVTATNTSAAGTVTISGGTATYTSPSAEARIRTYGTFDLMSTGDWTYTLDIMDPDFIALSGWQTDTETLDFTAMVGGQSVTGSITVTVMGVNDAPGIGTRIEAQTATAGGERKVVALAGAFRDPDTDETETLTYTVRSSDTDVATVSITTSALLFVTTGGPGITIVPVTAGSAGITVTATDDAGASAMQTFPVEVMPDAEGYLARQYLQTTSASINMTALHIVNRSPEPQRFTGSLFARDGTRLGRASQSLGMAVAPNARLILGSENLEAIFGVSPWRGPAMLEVAGSADFSLMSRLISPSGLVSNTNCVREGNVLNVEGLLQADGSDTPDRTYIRFINVTDETLGEVRGTLYDGQGAIIGNRGALLLASVAPRAQVWLDRDDLARLVGTPTWTGEAMLTVTGRFPQVAGGSGLKLLNLNLVNGADGTFFNFSCFEDSDKDSRVYLQTTSTSQNVSLTHVVNTANLRQRFTGTLYAASGEQLGDANRPLHEGTVGSRGRVILSSADLERIFGVSPWSGPAMLEVTGGDGTFALMTKLTSPSGLVSNTNCVREGQVYNILGSDSADRTYIRFINIGETTLTDLRGTLYDNEGRVIGSRDLLLLPALAPKAQVWLTRDDLAELAGDTWQGTASLVVAPAPATLRLLNLNFVNNETFFNFSCYEQTR